MWKLKEILTDFISFILSNTFCWFFEWPNLFFIIIAASSLEIFSIFFHFVLLFWNHIFTYQRWREVIENKKKTTKIRTLTHHPFSLRMIFCSLPMRISNGKATLELVFATSKRQVHILTCCCVTFRFDAISALSADERYFLLSKLFSSSKICFPVKVVRIFFFPLTSSPQPSVSLSMSFLLLFFLPKSFEETRNSYFLHVS